MYIVHQFGIGGLEKVVVDLINNLDKSQFKPTVCCLTTTGPSEQKITYPVKIFEMHKKKGNDFKLPFRLARLFIDEKIDVVQSANWGTYLETIFGAKIAKVPVLIHTEHGLELDEYCGGMTWKISGQNCRCFQ